MESPLEQASAKTIEEVLGWVRESKGFVLDQAPDLAQQYLAWYKISHWIWAAVCGVLFLIFLLGVYSEFSGNKEGSLAGPKDESGKNCVVVLSLISVGFGLVNAFALAKVYVAPKIVLLEGLSKLF